MMFSSKTSQPGQSPDNNSDKYVRKRVFVAAQVDPVLIEKLRADPRFELDYHPVNNELSLIKRLGGVEVLVTRYHNRITARVVDSASELRLIVQGTSGIDNIDLAAAERKKVRVIAIPGENANAVVEWVVGVMVSLTRTLPYYTRQMREGIWERDDCATRRELRSYRLGIIGIGRVGSRVAKMARTFGMQPVAYDPYVSGKEAARRGASKIESYEELLSQCDIVTFHVPLTEETTRMMASPQLEMLPEGAILINASRGPVVDQAAVLHALQSNRLGGAALDVFDQEPPGGLEWPDDPRLILTPHIAGCSRESKASIAGMIYDKIQEFYELS